MEALPSFYQLLLKVGLKVFALDLRIEKLLQEARTSRREGLGTLHYVLLHPRADQEVGSFGVLIHEQAS